MSQERRGQDLTESAATIPSDSENYDSSNNELSPSPPFSSSSPMIIYSPPTIWGLLRGAAINLLLPFVNGLMLGFGELLAHEAAFRLGWSGTKVRNSAVLQKKKSSEGSVGRPDRCLLRPDLLCFCRDLSPYAQVDNVFRQIFPSQRSSRLVGPGIEIRDDPGERMRREQELNDMTSLE